MNIYVYEGLDHRLCVYILRSVSDISNRHLKHLLCSVLHFALVTYSLIQALQHFETIGCPCLFYS